MDEQHEQRVEKERERGRGEAHNASVYHDDVQRHVCKKGDLSDRRERKKNSSRLAFRDPRLLVTPCYHPHTRRCRERINPRTASPLPFLSILWSVRFREYLAAVF